jgi:acyl dehydratase
MTGREERHERVAPTGKAHRFELVEIPEDFGPRELVVDEPRVKAFAFAQDDYGPWHFSASPFGAPVGHASILANELMQIYFERYRIDVHEDRAAGTENGHHGQGAWLEEAHVEETLWFESPVFVGETVTLRGRFADKYVRGGRGAVVLEGEAHAGDGRPIMGHRAIEYFGMDGPADDTAPARAEEPMRRVSPEPAPGVAPACSAHAGIAPGTPIAPLSKTISFPQQLVFSTLDYPEAQRSVHTDLAIAHRAGLAAPLVQGQQLACHVCESMTRFFGAAWYTSGWVRIKFLGGVCAGETIRVCGAVHGSARRGPSDVLELDLWVENGSGTIVAVANARASLAATETGDGAG